MSYRVLKPKKGQALVLRKCYRKEGKLTSRNNFIWPEKGPVEAPDFKPTFKCGHGLHGLLWGAGSPGYLGGDTWLCVLVDADSDNLMTGQGELTDKCKFRAALDVSVGELSEIIGNIQRYAPAGTLINFAIQGCKEDSKSTQTAGDESTQTAGNESTQTAGNRSTQTAGYKSTQTAGNESTQTAGNWSTFQAGINSVLIGRWWDGDKYCVSTMTIDEQTANKKIFFKQGVFTVQDEPALEKAGE